jgi:predicted Zn-dependent protease
MVRSLLNPALAALVLLLAGCVTQLPPSAPLPPVEERGDDAAESTTATKSTHREDSAASANQAPSSPPRTRGDSATPVPSPGADPATAALLARSDSAVKAGNPGEAIAYVERAMRIRPNDPLLWMRLAELQLANDDPVAAEQLARRAVSLSGSSEVLARRAWLLVADARAAQGDQIEARRIRAEWQTGRG